MSSNSCSQSKNYCQRSLLLSSQAAVPRSSTNEVFLKISQSVQENICFGVSFYSKETPTQAFFCEFLESFKNIFLQNTSGDYFYIFFLLHCTKNEVFP